ncbi:MAG: isoleucine--tRNA ligase [Promethearchaeota archaeon]
MTLPEDENRILEYWRNNSIPETTFKKETCGDKPKGRFQFTEGPPTANGLPGVHHVYARSIKDIIIRYRFMNGYWVTRKAGWDTHGLPVELEVEKMLGFKKKKDILDYGIDKFNRQCRESVFKYVKEWEKLTERMGFWLDMKNPYITCENYYIESVWWSLKQLFDRDLIYKGKKVVPFCPRCETSLSSHELSLGYKKISENSIYIKFKLLDPEFDGAKIVAWTTTPWTLLSNVAIAANADRRYSMVEYNGEKLIIATQLVDTVLGAGNYKTIREFFGVDFLHKKYEPLFPYFQHLSKENGFIVITADFVDTEPSSENISTGFVHIAPAFGEDDFNVGIEYNLPFIQPIDEKGFFDNTIPELKGKYFKIDREDIGKKGVWDTDKWVIEQLEKMGKLLGTREYVHDYPFCWRCKKALIYYARESWFIKMSKFRVKLLDMNEKVNWHPPAIGKGRFGNFLENARDWAISRERFWGIPLPIWICENEKCKHMIAIGSFEDLKNLSKGNVTLDDYHKPMVDEVIMTCPKCQSDMKRTPEVIDCWYDSGSAPFAQYHYPFENKDLIDKDLAYPVDFIAEGMDQTRGWFYTLHAIATVVFNKNAFNNVIVNGIITDKDGQKMSKTLGNVIDPWTIFNTYGADSIRWYYYVSGPPHKGKAMSMEKIRYIVSQFILKYWNSFKLLLENAKNGGIKPVLDFDLNELKDPTDSWIVSEINNLTKNVQHHLENYTIYPAASLINDFVINTLSNGYLRLNRKRFLNKDRNAFNVMYYVFDILNRLLAPFVPFITEKVFLEMKNNFNYCPNINSVHFLNFPTPNEDVIDSNAINEMKFVNALIQDMRSLRDARKIKIRQPVKEYVISLGENEKKMIDKYIAIIKSELNVKNIKIVDNDTIKGMYKIEPRINKGALGQSFKQDRIAVEKYLQSMNVDDLRKKLKKGNATIKINDKELEITNEHVEFQYTANPPYEVGIFPHATILLNYELDDDLLREGFARDFIRNVQNIRKKLKLSRSKEKITICIKEDINIEEELGKFVENVKEETGCEKFTKKCEGKEFPIKIQNKKLTLVINVL